MKWDVDHLEIDLHNTQRNYDRLQKERCTDRLQKERCTLKKKELSAAGIIVTGSF